MANFRCSVIQGKSAGKCIMLGMISAADLIELLRTKMISVNENAQRSLGKTLEESTVDLLDDDRIENTPRMKSITKFLKRVMDNVEKNSPSNEEGFFGCLQLAIPDNFHGARLIVANIDPRQENLPNRLYDVMVSSRSKNLGVLEISTTLSETAMFIGDGQGRAFGFHSFLRKVEKEINMLKKKIRKNEKKNESIDEEKTLLLEQEKLKGRIDSFLSTTDVAFMCYASSTNDDGHLSGLSEKAQARLFIEGNALNSQATQEDILRYESISPIIVGLQQERMNNQWMSPEYIEENKKSISMSSPRLFTLSALVQAYSISLLGESKPNDISEKTFDCVGERSEFVSKFWSNVSELFEPVWIPQSYTVLGYSGRSDYIQEMRGEKHRNVLFQAVFLQALGNLCYEMGKKINWNEQSDIFNLMRGLSPSRVDYDAVERSQESPDGKPNVIWRDMWKDSLMKASTDKDGQFKGYTFNNTKVSIDNGYRVLAQLIGLRKLNKSESSKLAEPDSALV
jgi:regulator of replication initiation timing